MVRYKMFFLITCLPDLLYVSVYTCVLYARSIRTVSNLRRYHTKMHITVQYIVQYCAKVQQLLLNGNKIFNSRRKSGRTRVGLEQGKSCAKLRRLLGFESGTSQGIGCEACSLNPCLRGIVNLPIYLFIHACNYLSNTFSFIVFLALNRSLYSSVLLLLTLFVSPLLLGPPPLF